MPEKVRVAPQEHKGCPNIEKCKDCATKSQYFSLFSNVFLAAFKGVAGTLTGSIGLIADATHSSADVLNSFVVMLAMNISKIPPDENHPYGHGKVENICGLFVGVVLFFGAVLIMDSSIEQLMNPEPLIPPHSIGIIVAIISILTNEVFFRVEYCAARQVNSPALEADATENRADSITTVAVLIGMLGAQFGYPKADPMAALAVGVITGPIAWHLLSKNISGLMDGGQTLDQVAMINKLVTENPEVKGVNYIKTRYTGSDLLIELEVMIGSDTSIARSDEIASEIKKKLKPNFEHLGDVIIVCRSENTKDPDLISALQVQTTATEIKEHDLMTSLQKMANEKKTI
ncbi:MAG: cation transporter [Candidatus Riflebacteria bacterium]|nr:cation transporter [Candidatus Riflebacteria bacterium]